MPATERPQSKNNHRKSINCLTKNRTPNLPLPPS